jgi:photosystem II stability/assembly factor-like uncharacterized protein
MSLVQRSPRGKIPMYNRRMRIALTLLMLQILSRPVAAQWVTQHSGTNARLRGVCAVSEIVAWASGAGGTVLLTTDGGNTWARRIVPDAEELDFRDIEAFSGRLAFVLSIGDGRLSRIYKTIDGGATWTLQHTNTDPKGYLDALAFWDADHGLAVGDPVDGRFVVLASDDGGKTWNRSAAGKMPVALGGEGAFAASGTSLVVQGDRNAWFGTGAGRVFRSTDRGRSWTAFETCIRSGNASSGIFSLMFWSSDAGIAVGGDYKEPGRAGKLCALTSDGGRTWRLPRGPEPAGFRSAVFHFPGSRGPTLFAVGPTGTDRSDDGGESWTKSSGEGFHAASRRDRAAGWAVGENGRIARFDADAQNSPAP